MKRIQEYAAQAEHHHAAQPRQRARRRRAGDPAAGRRPHRGAAARRAGRRRAPRTSSAAPRRWKCAWWPRSTRAQRRSPPAPRPARPFGTEYDGERNGQPLLVKTPGRAHRRPVHRRAATASTTRPTSPAVHRATSTARAARIMREVTRENVKQAHGDHAVREGQGRGDLRAGDPAARSRQPVPDHRPHDAPPRPTTSRCCSAPARSPRRWRSSRSAPSARAWASDNIEKGFNATMWGFIAIVVVHVGVLRAVRRDLVDRARR